jgi:addiction module HigA family antidote
MVPLGMSMNKLVLDFRLPVIRVAEIVHERRGITRDTALRLGRYFNTSARFWLRRSQGGLDPARFHPVAGGEEYRYRIRFRYEGHLDGVWGEPRDRDERVLSKKPRPGEEINKYEDECQAAAGPRQGSVIPKALATSTDPNANEVRAVTNAVNPLVADVFALYVKTKNFHWDLSGRRFRDYHLLFDEQAAVILESIDTLAERARKIGGITLNSIGHIGTRAEDQRRRRGVCAAPGDGPAARPWVEELSTSGSKAGAG